MPKTNNSNQVSNIYEGSVPITDRSSNELTEKGDESREELYHTRVDQILTLYEMIQLQSLLE